MQKNTTHISGIVAAIEESHKSNNQLFYRFIVKVPRLSGNFDYIPLVVSEKLLFNNPIGVGDIITTTGDIRTINKRVGDRKTLAVFNYVFELEKITEEEFESIADKNEVIIHGNVVKKPLYRKTGNGRRITELLIAHNRQHNKSAYVPAISWGVHAGFAKNFIVGQEIEIKGRFQSRDFTTKTKGDQTAYELSVASLEVVQ